VKILKYFISSEFWQFFQKSENPDLTKILHVNDPLAEMLLVADFGTRQE